MGNRKQLQQCGSVVDPIAGCGHRAHVEARPFANSDHDSRRSPLELVTRKIDLSGQITLLPVVPPKELRYDDRIGKQLTFETLCLDDAIEPIGIDSRDALRMRAQPFGIWARA